MLKSSLTFIILLITYTCASVAESVEGNMTQAYHEGIRGNSPGVKNITAADMGETARYVYVENLVVPCSSDKSVMSGSVVNDDVYSVVDSEGNYECDVEAQKNALYQNLFGVELKETDEGPPTEKKKRFIQNFSLLSFNVSVLEGTAVVAGELTLGAAVGAGAIAVAVGAIWVGFKSAYNRFATDVEVRNHVDFYVGASDNALQKSEEVSIERKNQQFDQDAAAKCLRLGEDRNYSRITCNLHIEGERTDDNLNGRYEADQDIQFVNRP